MKIYFLRHQAAGIVHKYPFSSPPTNEQRAAVERECFQQHGASHPKTGESYWMTVVDVDLVGASERSLRLRPRVLHALRSKPSAPSAILPNHI